MNFSVFAYDVNTGDTVIIIRCFEKEGQGVFCIKCNVSAQAVYGQQHYHTTFTIKPHEMKSVHPKHKVNTSPNANAKIALKIIGTAELCAKHVHVSYENSH